MERLQLDLVLWVLSHDKNTNYNRGIAKAFERQLEAGQGPFFFRLGHLFLLFPSQKPLGED